MEKMTLKELLANLRHCASPISCLFLLGRRRSMEEAGRRRKKRVKEGGQRVRGIEEGGEGSEQGRERGSQT